MKSKTLEEMMVACAGFEKKEEDDVEVKKKADVCEDLEVTTGEIFMRAYNAIPVKYVAEKRELWVVADWINTCDFFFMKK